MDEYSERLLFIVRRACLHEQVSRAQVMRVFGVSGVTARKDLAAAAARWPDYLAYVPSHGVRAKPFAVPPDEASSTAFLDLLQSGAQASALGLLPAESMHGAQVPRFIYRGLSDRQMVMTLYRACIRRVAVDIEYVGLRLGEMRRTRTVLPLGLELLGSQWRMLAHDVDERTRRIDVAQKTFVLARIWKAQLNPALQGKKLKSPTGERLDVQALQIERADRSYQVVLNRRLTPDQAEAVAREFALVRHGDLYLIRMPERDLVEFRRDHCARPVFPDDQDALKDFVLPVFESIRPYDAP